MKCCLLGHEHKHRKCGHGWCPGNRTYKAKGLAVEEPQSLGGLVLPQAEVLALAVSLALPGHLWSLLLHTTKGLWSEMIRCSEMARFEVLIHKMGTLLPSHT